MNISGMNEIICIQCCVEGILPYMAVECRPGSVERKHTNYGIWACEWTDHYFPRFWLAVVSCSSFTVWDQICSCSLFVDATEKKTVKMEQIKKKMATLKATLDEAESRAQKAEDELENANERATSVSCLFMISFGFCLFVCRWNLEDIPLWKCLPFS